MGLESNIIREATTAKECLGIDGSIDFAFIHWNSGDCREIRVNYCFQKHDLIILNGKPDWLKEWPKSWFNDDLETLKNEIVSECHDYVNTYLDEGKIEIIWCV